MRGEKLTLEERLERAAGSQAASPEAAASLVRRLARTYTHLLFNGKEDLSLMDLQMGVYLDRLGEDVLRYSGFCRGFQLAAEDSRRDLDGDPLQLAVDTYVCNALVLLGLMLLDHARGRRRNKELYHCTRMTLGQYLDALKESFFGEDGPESRRFQAWREAFLKRRDPSAPLADALADVLRQYIAGWRVFDRLDHILNCSVEFGHYLYAIYMEEQEAANPAYWEAVRKCNAILGVEEAELERCPDPNRHYLDLALAYSGDLPDPGGEGTEAGAVRDQIFLPHWVSSSESLWTVAEDPPSPEFQALLEENGSSERLEGAVADINTAVADLFMLWVEPYLHSAGEGTTGQMK